MANEGLWNITVSDPEGEAPGIRAVIFHNPDVAMAQLFYTIVAATTTLSYPPIWDQPYHI